MYNATVKRYDSNGTLISTFAAQVSDTGHMLRSNSVQCTGLEGTPAYDAYVRANAYQGDTLLVTVDGAAGYRAAIRSLMLPATYR